MSCSYDAVMTIDRWKCQACKIWLCHRTLSVILYPVNDFVVGDSVLCRACWKRTCVCAQPFQHRPVNIASSSYLCLCKEYQYIQRDDDERFRSIVHIHSCSSWLYTSKYERLPVHRFGRECLPRLLVK